VNPPSESESEREGGDDDLKKAGESEGVIGGERED